MHRFQIIAHTQMGESIALVGSTPELGGWDITRCLRLKTSATRYPLWWTDTPVDLTAEQAASPQQHQSEKIEYKYLLLDTEGHVRWESFAPNRWLPLDPDPASSLPKAGLLIVDDGAFDYWQSYPFAYLETPVDQPNLPPGPNGLKVVVIGSSVAQGYKSWLLEGWSSLLTQALRQTYGHQVVNVAELGSNVRRTLERFPEVVVPEQPDIVIIALSLGNEGLAYCPAHERRAVQRRFESGLLQLIKMTRALGAQPILGGVYPNNNYTAAHYELLQETHQRLLSWDVPVLDWLSVVDDGQGHWQASLSADPAHPNTLGHRLMYEAINLDLFQLTKAEISETNQRFLACPEIPVYLDESGFQVFACPPEHRLRINNTSPHTYTLAAYWQEIQTALQTKAHLTPGIYLAQPPQQGILPYLSVATNGTVETLIEIPAGTEQAYLDTQALLADNAQLLFYDGQIGLLKTDDHHLWIINESPHEFNIHPMWKEVRNALKALPSGVYEDALAPDAPFRTLMIGDQGLESRVKAPPRSAIHFTYQCPLSALSRVAIIPLGARCAARMMLYKMEYDGPAFPFDLTRTTHIADVADIIENCFYDMWNPSFLHYSEEEGRIYHSKWTGLSFAHEVEETEDPVNNMAPIYDRMRTRYSARSDRFWYTLRHCDQALFVRNGIADRGSVMNLMTKLSASCQGKPFQLLLLSPQTSEEFTGLPNVLHYNLEFNPDRMYEDLGHWLYCTDVMRDILTSLGISSKNLFWCPPNVTPA